MFLYLILRLQLFHVKLFSQSVTIFTNDKVFYGQEPPSGQSTTTECGVNYQPLAVITE